MPQHPSHEDDRRASAGRRQLGGFILPLLLLVAGGGCAMHRTDIVLGPSYQPANVFIAPQAPAAWPRRVAVLPLTTDVPGLTGEHGVNSLQPVIQAELTEAKQFELVFIGPEQLKQWTGRAVWKAEEALPASLFENLREKSACEAVLFVRLTAYRPYPPLALGWNVKLTDSRAQTIWWSVDELFDAGQPNVVNGARSYYLSHSREQAPLNDSHSVLSSPIRFTQYSFSTVLATLPNRAGSVKTAKVLPDLADK